MLCWNSVIDKSFCVSVQSRFLMLFPSGNSREMYLTKFNDKCSTLLNVTLLRLLIIWITTRYILTIFSIYFFINNAWYILPEENVSILLIWMYCYVSESLCSYMNTNFIFFYIKQKADKNSLLLYYIWCLNPVQ